MRITSQQASHFVTNVICFFHFKMQKVIYVLKMSQIQRHESGHCCILVELGLCNIHICLLWRTNNSIHIHVFVIIFLAQCDDELVVINCHLYNAAKLSQI